MASEVVVNPFIQTLINFGTAQILTFVLMLTLSYAILRNTKVFGDPKDNNNNALYMIISITIAFLIYISPVGQGIDLWFSKYFLHILIVLVSVLGAVMIIGMTGHEIGGKDNPLIPSKSISIIVGSVIAFAIFLNAGGFSLFGINHELIPGDSFFSIFDNIEITSDTVGSLLAGAVILAIIALPIWLVISELGFVGSKNDKP